MCLFDRFMYVMFQLRPFTVHNVFPCFYGPNKVIIIIIITSGTSNNVVTVEWPATRRSRNNCGNT